MTEAQRQEVSYPRPYRGRGGVKTPNRVIPEPVLVWGPGGNTSLRVGGGRPSVCMKYLLVRELVGDHCDTPKAAIEKSGCGKRSRVTRGVLGLRSRCRRNFSQVERSHHGRGCPGGSGLPSLGVCKQRLGEAIHLLAWQLWSNPCRLALRELRGCSAGQTEPVAGHVCCQNSEDIHQGSRARTSET